MTLVKVKGFQIYRDRLGKWRCYHRATRTPVDLEKCPLGSAEFFAECRRFTSLAEAGNTPKPGTLDLLIRDYRAHQDFLGLKARTRADYQRCFDYLQAIGDTPLVRFTPPLVVKIRDKAGEKLGRKWGTYVKTVLSLLFSWGLERGYVDTNPAFKVKGLKKPKGAPEANRPWTDAEREVVPLAMPPHMRLPTALMMYCGLDPGDALRLPKTAIADGMLNTRRAKTDQPVWVPLPTPVREALAAAPIHNAITLCANSYGEPWTTTGFASSWFPIRKSLEAEGKIGTGLTHKGLRHTVATILAEMGYDERTIADMLGQKTIEMARHYARRADKSRKLTAVVKDFEAELNKRRTKTV